jgi:very-short-patch-repair endonuclease
MPTKKRLPNLTYSPLLKKRSTKLRNLPTPAEKHFWNCLREMPFYEALTFNRQKPIGRYIVDFYCHRSQLVVEIDGDSHGESLTQIRDVERTEYLESQGLAVLRFTNREVEGNIEAVMLKVEEFIDMKKANPPSPLRRRGSKP